MNSIIVIDRGLYANNQIAFIDSPTFNDSGSYMCEGRGYDNDVISNVVRLVVYGM